MAKKVKKSKNTKALTIKDIQPDLDNIFSSLTKEQKDKKRMMFYLYWLFGFPIKSCAKLAGYSESYSYNLVQKYSNQPKLRQRVDEILNLFPEQYRAVCKLRLPQIAEIEAKALGEYEDKPRLAIDKPQLLKQLKQGSGVDLADNPGPPPPMTFNVKEMRLMVSALAPDHAKPPEQISDAEITTINDEENNEKN